MPTKDEITDIATDIEMQLASARDSAEAAQDLVKQYNAEMGGNLDGEAFLKTIKTIDKAMQVLPGS